MLEVKNDVKHSKPRNLCELEEIGLVQLIINGSGKGQTYFMIIYLIRTSGDW